MARTKQTALRPGQKKGRTTSKNLIDNHTPAPPVHTTVPNRVKLYDVNRRRLDSLADGLFERDPDVFKAFDHSTDQNDYNRDRDLLHEHSHFSDFYGMVEVDEDRDDGLETFFFKYDGYQVKVTGPKPDPTTGEYEIDTICAVRVSYGYKKTKVVQYLVKFRGWDDVASMMWLDEKCLMHVREAVFDFYRRHFGIYLGGPPETFERFQDYKVPSAFQSFLYRGLSSPYFETRKGFIIGAPVNIFCSLGVTETGYRGISHCPLTICDRVCCGGSGQYASLSPGVRTGKDTIKLPCSTEATTLNAWNWVPHVARKHYVPTLPWDKAGEKVLDQACRRLSDEVFKELNSGGGVFRRLGFYTKLSGRGHGVTPLPGPPLVTSVRRALFSSSKESVVEVQLPAKRIRTPRVMMDL